VAAGSSIGAFNAVAVLCRFPDAFVQAIGMSGTYDIAPLVGDGAGMDLYFSAPLYFQPELDGEHLERLRARYVLLASGQGRWEDIGQSWRMARVLGDKGVPNRVDAWGPESDHDWPT
jgi:esterase/lipase superfamily enzyme